MADIKITTNLVDDQSNTILKYNGVNIKNDNIITKDPTGFVSPELVIVNYDSTNRTITLTGTTTAYFRGTLVSALISGWVSAAHTATNGNWFLYYDGTNFVWSQTPWTFDMLQIAFVFYSTANKFSLKETHGLMSWSTHQELHETIGTYRSSGGDFTALIQNSTTAAHRRPVISQCVIKDEDLEVTLPILNNGLYTHRYLTSTGVTTFTTGNADIISLSTNQPYYNNFANPTWGQTLFPNNAYGAIFVMSVPVASDTTSQLYRFEFIQPQTVSTSLGTIKALGISSVNLGDAILSEYVFIQKIIVRYTASNWVITESTKLTGTNSNNTAIQGSFLSSITTSGNLLTGAGTIASPLTAQSLDGWFDYNDVTTQSTPITATANTPVALTCDGAGAYSNSTYKPLDVTKLWDTATNRLYLKELAIGDEVLIRVDIVATTLSINTDINMYITFDIGGAPYNIAIMNTISYKSTGTYYITIDKHFYIGNSGTLDNPAAIYFVSDKDSTFKVNGIYISTKRRYV